MKQFNFMAVKHFSSCLAVLFMGTCAAFMAGCATNPVTGKSQFMLLSESGEVSLDRQASPHQLSADYGAAQDDELNRYVASVGNALASVSDRPDMPYSFRVVNAVYVNAYAFPAGTIAVSRGIMANLQSESELAALLGHEIGHVCARHAASQYTKGILGSVAVAAAAIAVQTQDEDFAGITAGLGSLASGALLASYSRDNEREADSLALRYMTRGGYNPSGCISLMDMLRRTAEREPNVIEKLFATHPMSDERYDTAVKEAEAKYAFAKAYPLYRERFIEKTARLRAATNAIALMQSAEKDMAAKKLDAAEASLKAALVEQPRDYAALLMLAKCNMARKKFAEAERNADEAARAYPQEPQALHVRGMARLANNRYELALADFTEYGRLLPGNPNTFFFTGYAQEHLRQRDAAARNYTAFLREVNEGDNARHAYRRLVEWGYIRPQTTSR